MRRPSWPCCSRICLPRSASCRPCSWSNAWVGIWSSCEPRVGTCPRRRAPIWPTGSLRAGWSAATPAAAKRSTSSRPRPSRRCVSCRGFRSNVPWRPRAASPSRPSRIHRSASSSCFGSASASTPRSRQSARVGYRPWPRIVPWSGCGRSWPWRTSWPATFAASATSFRGSTGTFASVSWRARAAGARYWRRCSPAST